MSKSNKATAGVLEYRQFIVLPDGQEFRVRYNQDPSLYAGTDVPLFSYKAKEGRGENAKVVERFAVPFEQAIRASRTTTKANIENLLKSGMTAEEIIAKLTA